MAAEPASRLELLENLVAKQQQRLDRLEALVDSLTRGAEGPAARSIAAAVAATCAGGAAVPNGMLTTPLAAHEALVPQITERSRTDPVKGLSDSTRILTEAYQKRLALMSDACDDSFRPGPPPDGIPYGGAANHSGGSLDGPAYSCQPPSPPKPPLASGGSIRAPSGAAARPRSSEESSRLGGGRRPARGGVEEVVHGSSLRHASSPDVTAGRRRAPPRDSRDGGGVGESRPASEYRPSSGSEYRPGSGSEYRPGSGSEYRPTSGSEYRPGSGSEYRSTSGSEYRPSGAEPRSSSRGASEGLLTRPISAHRSSSLVPESPTSPSAGPPAGIWASNAAPACIWASSPASIGSSSSSPAGIGADTPGLPRPPSADRRVSGGNLHTGGGGNLHIGGGGNPPAGGNNGYTGGGGNNVYTGSGGNQPAGGGGNNVHTGSRPDSAGRGDRERPSLLADRVITSNAGGGSPFPHDRLEGGDRRRHSVNERPSGGGGGSPYPLPRAGGERPISGGGGGPRPASGGGGGGGGGPPPSNAPRVGRKQSSYDRCSCVSREGGHSARGSCSLEPMPAPAIERVALLEGSQERPVQVRLVWGGTVCVLGW